MERSYLWPGKRVMSNGFTVKFWGVRGSVPAPGAATVKYGGNTSCVEVRADDRLIVLDAGTGIRLLGKSLNAPSQPVLHEITLLLTHTHWDHIQGLPFFIPQLRPGSRLRILGCEGAREGLATLLARQMESPFFPVPLRGSAASILIEEFKDSEFRVGAVVGRTFPANHPGACVGYRLEFQGGSIAYFPDNEPYLGRFRVGETLPEPQDMQKARQGHMAMLDFIRGVDVLIMDAQYDSEEYAKHLGWGHGCVDDVVALAIEGGVKKLLLFHHDPDHSDSRINQMARKARTMVRKAGAKLEVHAAREGTVLTVPDGNV